MNRRTQKREITLTKELARRLQKKLPNFHVYANKCPSRGEKIKRRWQEVFKDACPPLQPEIDIIISEPPSREHAEHRLRAIEIKYFESVNGRVNQSFYKGIEQALALLQWGFDNVALWQLFDESLSDADLRNYGCKTWTYVHVLLDLPIDFTPIRIIGEDLATMRFQVIQADWLNNLRPIPLLDLDSPGFHIKYSHGNPLIDWRKFVKRFEVPIGNRVYLRPGANTLGKEVRTLRQFLLEWLPTQHGL